MSKVAALQVNPGRGLGFLSNPPDLRPARVHHITLLILGTALGASLHDILTRLKAHPHVYPRIDVSYSPSEPLKAPVVLNLTPNGVRLRFDGPDQRLRLIEVFDFTKTQLSYKGIDLIKLPEITTGVTTGPPAQPTGPAFRHVYNKLIGPTFPGEYVPPPTGGSEPQTGLYVLSYPGIAFTFQLQHSAWSPNIDFVSLLSSTAASSTKSLAIFNGPSWQEVRRDLLVQACPNPRSIALSGRGKELRPDEIDLVKICGSGRIEMIRRSSASFWILLGETTPQDLVAELGPPDAIYRKNDRRLSIHKSPRRDRRSYQRTSGSSPGNYDETTDTDQSSTNTATDESDADDEPISTDDKSGTQSAECFYNYFHHGFDVFISHPAEPSSPFPPSKPHIEWTYGPKGMEHLVATKVLLHANVPGSYPFNRYRRSRWVIDTQAPGESDTTLSSETPFSVLSQALKRIWHDSYASEHEEQSLQRGMVLNRGWGDSPGSSCELLGGWEESAETQRKGAGSNSFSGGPGFGNTELFGFPGLVFEVLKNDTVSCLTVY